MDILQSLDSPAVFPPMERAIFNMLRGALEYPASIEARATKIARDTLFFINDADPDVETGGVFGALWDVLLAMVCRTPAGHEWHQVLVLALDTVRQREGAANGESPDFDWSRLPKLSIQLTEHWERRPVKGDEAVPTRLTYWKNVNSFVSHLVGRGFSQVIHLAIWEVREALEDSATIGPLMDCRVWVATEWILCCSQGLLQEMKAPSEELSEDDAESLQTGHVYGSSLPPRSLQRWEFWKKRFSDVVNEAKDLGLEDETKNRVQEALKMMESQS